MKASIPLSELLSQVNLQVQPPALGFPGGAYTPPPDRCLPVAPFPGHRKLHSLQYSDHRPFVFFLDCFPFLPSYILASSVFSAGPNRVLCHRATATAAAVLCFLRRSQGMRMSPTIHDPAHTLLPRCTPSALCPVVRSLSSPSQKLQAFKPCSIILFSKPSNTSEVLRRKLKTLRPSIYQFQLCTQDKKARLPDSVGWNNTTAMSVLCWNGC